MQQSLTCLQLVNYESSQVQYNKKKKHKRIDNYIPMFFLAATVTLFLCSSWNSDISICSHWLLTKLQTHAVLTTTTLHIKAILH